MKSNEDNDMLYKIGKNMIDQYKRTKDKKFIKNYIDYVKTRIITKVEDYLLDEELLLQKIDGKTFIEHLCDSPINLLNSNITFKDPAFVKIFFNMNNPFLLSMCDLNNLFKKATLKYTYFDYVVCGLSMTNSLQRIDCSKIKDNKILAKVLLTYAKYEQLSYIDNLDANRLMEDDESGVKLVDELIKLNEDDFIDKILKDEYLKDLDLFAHLRLKKYEIEYLFDDENNMLKRDYLKEDFERMSKIKLDSYYEDLLNRFKNIMLCDNKSDYSLVNKVILCYRESISINPIFAYEVESLINVKMNYPDFHISITDNGSCYNESDYGVYLETTDDKTLINHEIGHALHYLVCENYIDIPKKLEKILSKLRRDKILIDKARNLAYSYETRKEAITKWRANKKYDNLVESKISSEMRMVLQSNLESVKDQLSKKYKDLGYDEEDVKMILDGVPSYEDVLKNEKEIETYNLTETIIKLEFPEYPIVGDIIDAIFKGAFLDCKLKDSNGTIIYGNHGHGMDYFKEDSHCFLEIIAQYSSMIKSGQSDRINSILRSYVGDELVDFLEEYYTNTILYSNMYQEENGMYL